MKSLHSQKHMQPCGLRVTWICEKCERVQRADELFWTYCGSSICRCCQLGFRSSHDWGEGVILLHSLRDCQHVKTAVLQIYQGIVFIQFNRVFLLSCSLEEIWIPPNPCIFVCTFGSESLTTCNISIKIQTHSHQHLNINQTMAALSLLCHHHQISTLKESLGSHWCAGIEIYYIWIHSTLRVIY